jgi:hypothetical protein
MLRLKVVLLVALTSFAATAGGGFCDNWFRW